MPSQNRDVTKDRGTASGKLPAPGQASAIQFDELAKGENEVVIEYENQKYRLRVTKNGKLILNK
jgi:hemin uptake protein HemP